MNTRTWIFVMAMVGLIGGGLLYRHFAQDVDSRGATRLMRAIEENDTEKAEKLLDGQEVNVRDKSGQTALFYAARNVTDPKVIYKLIVAGADPLATDKSGNTPLTTAAKYNTSPAVVMALAKQLAQSDQQQENKDKALVQAAKHNTAEVIKTLLAAQANPVGAQANKRNAYVFLAENERLTEQEKQDYRQVMLVLEILDQRAKYAKSLERGQPKPVEKKIENKGAQSPAKKETASQTKPTQETKPAAPTATKTATDKPDKPSNLVPQERQMDLSEKESN